MCGCSPLVQSHIPSLQRLTKRHSNVTRCTQSQRFENMLLGLAMTMRAHPHPRADLLTCTLRGTAIAGHASLAGASPDIDSSRNQQEALYTPHTAQCCTVHKTTTKKLTQHWVRHSKG